MPIVKPKAKPEVQLPAPLLEQAHQALFFQVVSQYHEQQYKDAKSELFTIIAADGSGVTLEVGKSLRFPGGLLRWQGRSNFAVNTDAIAEAVHANKVSIEAVLSCVGKFNAESLASLLPNAVSEADPTEFGVMQATPDYKQQIIARIEENDRILTEQAAQLLAEAQAEEQAEPQPVAKKRTRKPAITEAA